VSTLRRGAALVAIALATVLGLTVAPAQAAFTDQATITATAGTITVAPPTGLNTRGTGCSTTTWYYNYNGQVSSGTKTTVNARVQWTASPTNRVTSYVVTAHGTGWSTKVAEVPSSVTTVNASVDGPDADQGVTVTVTARTSYGWTAESKKSGVITC